MNLRNAVKILAALLVAALLVVGSYEAWQSYRYAQWRNTFQGTAWLGTVTVPSDNPELMWEYRPNARHKRIETNSHGFRGAETPRAKPASVTRVGFLGDSLTLGYGIDEADIFLRVFERIENRVSRPPNRVEALNFGIDGYATPQLAELLRTRVLDFAPDHLIYVLCLNDFDFTTSAGEKVLYFRKPRSFLEVKVEHLIRKLRGLDFHTHKFRRNRQRVFETISRMRSDAERGGATFELAVMPIFPVDVNSFAYYPHGEIHAALETFAEAEGLPFVDLLRIFVAAGGPPRAYATDVWHLNQDGHRLIGEALARRFEPPRD